MSTNPATKKKAASTQSASPLSVVPRRFAGPAAYLSPGRVMPGTSYRLVKWLGDGGSGTVYEVEHVDVGRKFALKLLHGVSERAANGMKAEARAASQIGSEYIADVFDIGELPDGRLFLVLDLVVGENLGEALSDGPLPLERVFPILRQLCKGLADAHRAGIPHRDVKPENVLLTEARGRKDAVRIVDFGLARTSPNGPGRGAGTPYFMAPECWTGVPSDHRVDVYAVGCTIYEMVTGKPPFRGTVDDVMLGHVEAAPPPLPGPLERVARTCLAKKPGERYENMAELEAAICEAQIAAGIETPWDDLAVPDVEETRRDRLLRDMPSSDELVVSRMPRWIGFAAAFLLASAAVAVAVWPSDAEQALEGLSRVDELVDEARSAASRAYFVYPPVDRDEETAYRKVVELQTLDADRAQALSDEFVTTLVRLGDRYWDHEGGRVFAVDYYAQALVFDPVHDRARARAPLTVGELATLRAKAAALDFTQAEREAVVPLEILAAGDVDTALDALEAYFVEERPRPIASERRVEKFLRKQGRRPKRRRAPDPSPVVAESERDASAPETTADASSSEPPSERVAAALPETAKNAAPIVENARRALAAGKRTKAQTLFHQALDRDPRSGPALIGLSNLRFERSDYFRAMSYAKRAVRAHPKRAAYRIALGDAYFKLLRYGDARDQYAWAQRLGHAGASARLAKVTDKLGK